jgi:4-amino-4-deoxy-L-arabinose transferase-like glycosyltransferase
VNVISAPPRLAVLGLLFIEALVLRLPFVFPAVINWDESTFVLVGQSLADGHLPYVEAWALKPPLAFALFGAVIAIFGKNLVAVRLAGTLCVVVTAFFVYLTATRLWHHRVGLMAASLYVATVSLLPAGQATMTEHVAILPLMAAVWRLTRNEPSVVTSFVAGVLLSVATLIRLNMAYVAVFVGLYLVVSSMRRGPFTTVLKVGAYVVGGGVVVLLTWLPYVLTGQHRLWWTSVVAAPLSYAHSRSSVFESLLFHLTAAFGTYRDGWSLRFYGSVLLALVWVGLANGAVILLRRWRAGQSARGGVAALVLVVTGVVIGILTSGVPHTHHLIQLAPFAAMLTSVSLGGGGWLRWPSWLAVGIVMVVSLVPVAAEYRALWSRAMAGEPLHYGAAYDIARYVKRDNPSARPLYLLDDHIAYWFADSQPPTPMTTHPSNISKPALIETVVGKDASPLEELRKVFRRKPEFVVMPERVWYLEREPSEWLEHILRDDYVLVAHVRGRKIYRIKSGPMSATCSHTMAAVTGVRHVG